MNLSADTHRSQRPGHLSRVALTCLVLSGQLIAGSGPDIARATNQATNPATTSETSQGSNPGSDPGSNQATTKATNSANDSTPNQALNNDINNMSAQYSQGRYVLAENLGREILARDPSNLKVHYLLGNIYFKLNDTQSASQQYTYCLRTGGNSSVAKMAASGLEGLKAAAKAPDAAATTGDTTHAASTSKGKGEKAPDLRTLKHAEAILERAQDALQSRKRQLDTMVSHAEEFARSRIKEIPPNTIYRRMSAFAGIEAARDNEDYYTAPNYDRPPEVARIRTTETAKVQGYIEQYSKQEKALVTSTLKEVDSLLGGTSDPEGRAEEAAVANPVAEVKSPKLPTNTSEAYTACGITTHKESAGHRVIMTRTGSAAHRAGLTAGDLIEQSTFIPGADLLKVTISRGGKRYALKMHPAASLAAEPPPRSKSNITVVSPKVAASQRAWARIKDSDIVFVQDMSANMRLPLGESGLSRWDWCAGRIIDFADSLSKNSTMGFTLIQCYQFVYEIYRDQSPAGLRQRFFASRAIEASNISLPLVNVANDYFDNHSQKPLLIMVFTDGHPERGESLELAVKAIADRASSADQVRLVFFQIGDDSAGTAMLQMLDDDLTYAGHKYDIVDCVKFEDLQESGVSRALLDAYERPRAAGQTTPPPIARGLTAKLDQVRKQIAAATAK